MLKITNKLVKFVINFEFYILDVNKFKKVGSPEKLSPLSFQAMLG